MSYYKKIGEQWFSGNLITLPGGNILDNGNPLEEEGWTWHEEPPQDYLDWKEEKRLEEIEQKIKNEQNY